MSLVEGQSGVVYVRDATRDNVVQAAGQLCVSENQGVLVLLADQDGLDLSAINDALRESGIPFLGGVFPGLLWEAQCLREGALLFRFPFVRLPLVLSGSDHGRVYEILSAWFPEEISEDYTLIVMVDGFRRGISEFLRALYGYFGSRPSYIGAGAGRRSTQKEQCLLNPDGVLENAAVLAIIPVQASIWVRHGWRPVGEPVLCTKSDQLCVHELNWKSAYDVYANVVKEHAGHRPTREEFFETSKHYPFGICRDGLEPIVRDPIAVHGDAIRCVGEVPENALLQVLHGTIDQLQVAAADAADSARRQGGVPYLVVDCVSRAIFQGDKFEDELRKVDEALSVGDGPCWGGVLSLGEVAQDASGRLELYNKTIVVGGFGG